MRYRATKSASTLVALLFLTASALSAQYQDHWHTRPDKWKEPRSFHTPENGYLEERVDLSHVEPSGDPQLKVFSPNGAYWAGVDPEKGFQLRDSKPKGVQFHVFSPDVPIYIFNERPKLITLTLKDHYPNFVVNLHWVNEKLLYVRVWWGRVLGTDFILDVEKEAIVYKETVNSGGIAFQQWQEMKQKNQPSDSTETDPNKDISPVHATE